MSPQRYASIALKITAGVGSVEYSMTSPRCRSVAQVDLPQSSPGAEMTSRGRTEMLLWNRRWLCTDQKTALVRSFRLMKACLAIAASRSSSSWAPSCGSAAGDHGVEGHRGSRCLVISRRAVGLAVMVLAHRLSELADPHLEPLRRRCRLGVALERVDDPAIRRASTVEREVADRLRLLDPVLKRTGPCFTRNASSVLAAGARRIGA